MDSFLLRRHGGNFRPIASAVCKNCRERARLQPRRTSVQFFSQRALAREELALPSCATPLFVPGTLV